MPFPGQFILITVVPPSPIPIIFKGIGNVKRMQLWDGMKWWRSHFSVLEWNGGPSEEVRLWAPCRWQCPLLGILQAMGGKTQDSAGEVACQKLPSKTSCKLRPSDSRLRLFGKRKRNKLNWKKHCFWSQSSWFDNLEQPLQGGKGSLGSGETGTAKWLKG